MSDTKKKIVGFLCDPGPGDALRFLHAFCELLDHTQMGGIVYCLPRARIRCGALLRHFNRKNGSGIEGVPVKNMDQLHDCLMQLKEGTVFHAFEEKYYVPGIKKFSEDFLTGLSVPLVQADRYQNGYFMRNCIRDHLEIPSCGDSLENTGLFFLRIVPVVPERNVSESIAGAVVDCAEKNGICLQLAGSPVPDSFRDILPADRWKEIYPWGDFPDYYTQICRFSQYSFAIGMNSGGLDLAAASGIPIIRIGEFHQHLQHLGADYNQFLHCCYTINIMSDGERDISNIDAKIIHKSVERLLNRQEKECEIIWM